MLNVDSARLDQFLMGALLSAQQSTPLSRKIMAAKAVLKLLHIRSRLTPVFTGVWL